MMIAAFIPARIAATRFPAKLLQPLGNYSVIATTYLNALRTNIFNDVFVVTDSQLIAHEIAAIGGKYIMSQKEHESGSDRIAEVIHDLPYHVIVNIQGDEPFVNKSALEKLLEPFLKDNSTKVSTLVQEMHNKDYINDPNYVKCAIDSHFKALFFSRSPIPYNRANIPNQVYYEHIGLYAYQKQILQRFTKTPPTPLECAEKIECLRFLEMGIPIDVRVTEYMGIEIDTPEDLIKAQNYLNSIENRM
ncbi:MAG: 3-deoxy-manno-octulosonate cytidylyltransferase [Alphaproteobacteria bacterium]|nr:3-deoxy-manno-octulosonate cytidylyltransferase [Alphaproteobacteria bacterium]